MRLRKQFEAWCKERDWNTSRWDIGGGYIDGTVAMFWTGYQAGHAAGRAEAEDVARSAAGLFHNLLHASKKNREHGYNGLKIEWEEQIEAELGRIDAFLKGGTNG